MTRRRLSLMLVAIAGLALFESCGCCCARYFPPDRELHRLVGADEITGTWCLNRYSVKLLERRDYSGGEKARIQLATDGTCHVQSFFDGDDWGEFIHVATDDCTWELRWLENIEVNRLKLSGVPMNEFYYLYGSGRTYSGFSFTKSDDGLTMFTFVGDPDEWEFLEYIRCDEETP